MSNTEAIKLLHQDWFDRNDENEKKVGKRIEKNIIKNKKELFKVCKKGDFDCVCNIITKLNLHNL